MLRGRVSEPPARVVEMESCSGDFHDLGCPGIDAGFQSHVRTVKEAVVMAFEFIHLDVAQFTSGIDAPAIIQSPDEFRRADQAG